MGRQARLPRERHGAVQDLAMPLHVAEIEHPAGQVRHDLDDHPRLVPILSAQDPAGQLDPLQHGERASAGAPRVAGQDALALRPTLLLALALKESSPAEKVEIRDLYESRGNDAQRLARLREIFESHGVFEKAEALVEKSRQRAESIADEIGTSDVRQLLYFLVDTVLAPEGEPTQLEQQQPNIEQPLLYTLPIVRMGTH